MTRQSAQDDLAYIRSIAEEGRNVPLIGGVSFVLWGVLIGVAAFIAFLMEIGVVPYFNATWLWSIAIATGWISSIVIGRNLSSRPGATSLSNKVVGAAWAACGIFVTVYWLSLVAAMLLNGEDGFPVHQLFATMFPIAFGLYGLAFFVTAVVVNQSWYRTVSFISWGVSVLLILSLAFRIDFYMLIASLGTFAVVVGPGVVIMRNEPSDVV